MASERHYSRARFQRALKAFLLGRFAQAAAFFTLTLLLVRFFAPDDYGYYMTVWGLVELATPLTSLGLLEAVRRFVPELAAHGSAIGLRQFVWRVRLYRLLFVAIAAVVIWVLWQALATYLGITSTQMVSPALIALAIACVVTARFSCEILEALLEQRWSQTANALQPLIRLSGFYLLVQDESLTVSAMLSIDIGAALLSLFIAEIGLARRMRSAADQGNAVVSNGHLFAFARDFAMTNVLVTISGIGAQRLLVARLGGSDAVAVFSFLQQLVISIERYMPAQLLASVIRPMLVARYAQGELETVSKGIALMWKSNWIIVIGCLVVLATYGDGIVEFLSGGQFDEAGLLAFVVFLGLAANCQNLVLTMTLLIYGQSQAVRNQSLLFAAVPLMAIVGSAYGVVGVLAGIVSVLWLRNAYGVFRLRHLGIRAKFDYYGLARILVAGIATSAITFSVLPAGPERLISAVIFSVLILLARPLSVGDVDLATLVAKPLGKYFRWLSVRT